MHTYNITLYSPSTDLTSEYSHFGTFTTAYDSAMSFTDLGIVVDIISIIREGA